MTAVSSGAALSGAERSLPEICFIGLGYVGLPTAALLAASGCRVTGVDINPEAVRRIRSGEAPFKEEGLGALVGESVATGLLTVQATPAPADIFVIAVPTPVTEGKQPCLDAVMGTSASLAPFLRPGNLLILESTSPVGTTEAIRDMIRALRPDLSLGDKVAISDDIDFAYCPERILPGNTVQELVHNARTVGGLGERAAQKAAAFYKHFCKGDILLTGARAAEMTKLVENSYRDVCIAFANELSVLCDDLDLDAREIIHLANRHPRVQILQPGTGVGGHCIPVDPWFIVSKNPAHSRLIATARAVNDGKPLYVAEKICARLGAALSPAGAIAFFGLSYKPDVDDARESPAIEVIKHVAARYPALEILVVDPFFDEPPRGMAQIPAPARLVSRDEALAQAGAAILLTAHTVFHDLAKDCAESGLLYLDAAAGFPAGRDSKISFSSAA